MIASNFEFNGIQAHDVGLWICSFDGSSSSSFDTVEIGSEITFDISLSTNGYKQHFHSAHYEKQYEIEFDVVKMKDCEPVPITPQEQAFYLRWLQRKDGYKYLRFLEDGFEEIYYNCKIAVSWRESCGVKYGATLKVTCDAPFGYSPIQSYETSISSGKTFEIYNDSDELGEIIPQQIEIQTLSAGNLIIENSMENLYSTNNYRSQILNCKKNETIIINGVNKQITTDNIIHKKTLAEDYNYNPPRLINLDERYDVPYTTTYSVADLRRNIFTVKGCDCNISMAYRTIRKAVV